MPLLKSESPILLSSPGRCKAAFLAARPKTWIAAISPVLIGNLLAVKEGAISWSFFALLLLFSLLLQIGANYSNDFFDFLHGVDTKERIGPKRASSEGWLSASTVRNLSIASFCLALCCAIPLMLHAGVWSLWAALVCCLFAVLYTGGPKPLGYLGLGEVLVLLFFGPLACSGSFFLQTDKLSPAVLLAGLAPGLLSSSILIANNLRDQISDKASGKNTLVVRFGRTFGAWEYFFSITLALFLPALLVLFFSFPYKLLATLFLFAPALLPIKKAFSAKTPQDYIPMLGQSALLLFLYTLFFSLTLFL